MESKISGHFPGFSHLSGIFQKLRLQKKFLDSWLETYLQNSLNTVLLSFSVFNLAAESNSTARDGRIPFGILAWGKILKKFSENSFLQAITHSSQFDWAEANAKNREKMTKNSENLKIW